MATQVQLRRGTSTENNSFTGAQGELTFDTTNKRVRVHDGGQAGGFVISTADASGNVNIDGTVTADGLTVDKEGSDHLKITDTSSSNTLTIGVGNTVGVISVDPTNAVASSDLDIEIDGNKAIRVAEGGDISFYDSQGSSQSFFWDAAAESLGIGTSSPSEKLHIVGGDVLIGTDSGAAFNGDAFLRIQGSSNNYINLKAGTSSNTGILLGDTDDTFVGGMVYSNADNALFFNAGNSERMRIDSSGHAIIPAGVTLGTAVGVYNAANTLDDYEEGTWTPSFGGNTGNPTVTYDTQSGYYRKVGDLVFVQGRITLSSASGGSGSLEIDGMPFASATGSDAVLSVSRLQGLGIDISASGPVGILVGPDFVYYTSNTTGNHTVLTTSALTNTTSINFSGCYAV